MNSALSTLTSIVDAERILDTGPEAFKSNVFEGTLDYTNGKRSFIYDSDVKSDVERVLKCLGGSLDSKGQKYYLSEGFKEIPFSELVDNVLKAKDYEKAGQLRDLRIALQAKIESSCD